jgi:hypothetical protein
MGSTLCTSYFCLMEKELIPPHALQAAEYATSKKTSCVHGWRGSSFKFPVISHSDIYSLFCLSRANNSLRARRGTNQHLRQSAGGQRVVRRHSLRARAGHCVYICCAALHQFPIGRVQERAQRSARLINWWPRASIYTNKVYFYELATILNY